MKKIILFLALFYNFAFADVAGYCPETTIFNNVTFYLTSNVLYQQGVTRSPYKSADYVNPYPKYSVVGQGYCEQYLPAGTVVFSSRNYWAYTMIRYELVSTPPVTCNPETQEEINGECYPKCPLNSTRNVDLTCTCNSGFKKNYVDGTCNAIESKECEVGFYWNYVTAKCESSNTPQCTEGLKWNYITQSCESGTLICNDPNEIANNGICKCKSGFTDFYDAGGNREGCIEDCSSKTPTTNVPKGWVTYINQHQSEVACQLESYNYPNKQYFWNVVTEGSCTFNICSIDKILPEGGCDYDDVKVIPKGFIFSGKVKDKQICLDLVDHINYVDANTQPVKANCSTDTDFYCYLAPSNENNDAGLPPENDPYCSKCDTVTLGGEWVNYKGNCKNTSTGGLVGCPIPPTPTPTPDLNLSTIPQNPLPLGSTDKTNSLLGQLSKDVKNISDILTASDNYWKAEQKRLSSARTKNDNENTNKIVSSIEGVGEKIDTTNSKLDDIIGLLNDSNDTRPPYDVNDTLPTDNNDTSSDGGDCGMFSPLVPDNLEGVVCGNQTLDGFFQDKMFDDGWYLSNAISLDFTPNVPCYLETLSLDFGDGSVDIITEERLEIIPFNFFSNLILACIYLLGFSLFVREK